MMMMRRVKHVVMKLNAGSERRGQLRCVASRQEAGERREEVADKFSDFQGAMGR